MRAKIFLGFMLSMFFSASFASVTWQQTQDIYRALIKANNLKPVPLKIDTDRDLNGYTDGRTVFITLGALNTLTADEMAFLLGHELAHVQYRDAETLLPVGKYKEDRADYYGSDYAKKIGYSKCKQANLFLKLYLMYGNNGGSNDPHSANMLRFKRISRGCNL